MRVVLLNNLFGRTARGGAETIIAQEAASLARAGHEVAVVALAADKDAISSDHGDGYRVIEVGTRHPFPYHGLREAGMPAKLAWHAVDVHGHGTASAALETIAARQPDIVHTHNLMGFGFRLPSLLRKAGLRHVHTVHDVQLLWPSGLLPAGAWPWWQRLAVAFRASVLRRIVGSPDVVLFPSEFQRALHQRYGFFPASKQQVLRNPAPAAALAARNFPAAPSFLFVGQLEAHKGIFSLLQAWRLLGPGAPSLHIVGGGSAEAEVRDAAAMLPPVTVHGRLPLPEVHARCRLASFMVVPSQVIETAPTVIVEAFAAGTPAIAAATGGIPEYVEEGKTGFLFTPGDAAACAEAAARAMALPSGQWQAMSEQARLRAVALTPERHAVELLAAYVMTGEKNRT